jgi:hypothetical protein
MKSRKRIEKHEILWKDEKGLSRVEFVENEYNIEGHSKLYFCVGGPAMIINLRVEINDMVKFLNEWSEMKLANLSTQGESK